MKRSGLSENTEHDDLTVQAVGPRDLADGDGRLGHVSRRCRRAPKHPGGTRRHVRRNGWPWPCARPGRSPCPCRRVRRGREQDATLVGRLGDGHGVRIVDQLPRQELHELPHASGSPPRRAPCGGVLGLGGPRRQRLGRAPGLDCAPSASARRWLGGGPRLRGVPAPRPLRAEPRPRRRPSLRPSSRPSRLGRLLGPRRDEVGRARALGRRTVPDADLHHEVADLARSAARRPAASAGRAPRRSR